MGKYTMIINIVALFMFYALIYKHILRDFIIQRGEYEVVKYMDYASLGTAILLAIVVLYSLTNLIRGVITTSYHAIKILKYVIMLSAFCGSIFGVLYTYDNHRNIFNIIGLSLLSIIGAVLTYVFAKRTSLISKLNDTTTSIKDEYSGLSSTSMYIILVQVIILCLYASFTSLKSYTLKVVQPSGNYLIKKSVSLSSRRNIASHDEMKKMYDVHGNDDSDYRYTLSCWVYLEPTNDNNTFNNILSYGSMPIINYNPANNHLRIQMVNVVNDSPTTLFETMDIPIQRWNHLVINYSSSTCDVFLNNTIVSTSENNIPTLNEDALIIGDNTSDFGRIRDVIYFKNILTKPQIRVLYNTQR